MKTKLENHGGRFISLQFKDGKKVKKACCKIIECSPQYVTFQDVNSYQVYKKKFTSFV
jgi:hypothetical protein